MISFPRSLKHLQKYVWFPQSLAGLECSTGCLEYGVEGKDSSGLICVPLYTTLPWAESLGCMEFSTDETGSSKTFILSKNSKNEKGLHINYVYISLWDGNQPASPNNYPQVILKFYYRSVITICSSIHSGVPVCIQPRPNEDLRGVCPPSRHWWASPCIHGIYHLEESRALDKWILELFN